MRFTCANCGADLVFVPSTGKLRCTACAAEQAIAPSEEGVASHDLRAVLDAAHQQHAKPLSQTALEVTCQGCGATVEFEPPKVAGQCPFCAAKMVMQPKAADPLIAPGAVLPFRLEQANANFSIRDWFNGLWFAPSALRDLALIQGLQGVYVPFWGFDANTVSSYTGQRGDAYYETVVRQLADGRREEQRVRRIRWSGARGVVQVRFDNLLIPATKSVQRIKLADLDPWDFENLIPYEPAYLAGFQAQRYQVELADGFELAKQLMDPRIQSAVRRDIGGDEQQIDSLNTRYSDVQFRHVLLPVWIGAYHFQGKLFQVLVNARTGEVQGDRPYSALKITLLVIAIIVVVAIVAMMNQR